MSDSLHSEVLVPTPDHTRRNLWLALGTSLIGAGVCLAAWPPPAASVTVTLPPSHAEVLTTSVQEPPAREQLPHQRSDELLFVFEAGGATYAKLADVNDELAIPHGTPRHVFDEESYVHAAIATVASDAVPGAYRAWHGRSVIVDGGCTTTVTGFAVIGRLVGDPGYAGIEWDEAADAEPGSAEDSLWTAAQVMTHGQPVLAARLAGCNGTFARAAVLPPPVTLEVLDTAAHAELAQTARAALLASPPAREAQREWTDAYMEQGSWHEQAHVTAQVMRHPITGVTWVAARARLEGGCGAPDVNLWGLYRVGDAGELAPVSVRALDEMTEIDAVLDVDGDGTLELLGRGWLRLDRVLAGADGTVRDRLGTQFYGCGC
jgi:hypothetical protein